MVIPKASVLDKAGVMRDLRAIATSWSRAERMPRLLSWPAIIAIGALGCTTFAATFLGLGVEAAVAAFLILVAMTLPPATTRVCTFLFGSVLLFQSDAVNIGVKLAFVALVAFMAMAALHNLLSEMDNAPDVMRQATVRWLLAASISIAVILVACASLIWTAVDLSAWARDTLNYLLVPCGLIIGAEAGSKLRPGAAYILALAVGYLGAYSYLAAWLSRRDYSQSGASQFGLASSFIVFAPLALCFAMFFSRRSVAWLVLGVSLGGIVLAGGGRQTIIYIALSLLAACVFSRAPLGSRFARLLIALAVATAGFFATLSLSRLFGGGVADRRFAFYGDLLSSGFTAITGDESAQGRALAYKWLFEGWLSSPAFGHGLGQPLLSLATGTPKQGTLTLDSPLVGLYKFGLLGAAMLCVALLLIAAGMTAHNEQSRSYRRPFSAACVALTLAYLPNGFPFENRGFSAFCLMAALLAVTSISPGPKLSAQAPIGRREG